MRFNYTLQDFSTIPSIERRPSFRVTIIAKVWCIIRIGLNMLLCLLCIIRIGLDIHVHCSVYCFIRIDLHVYMYMYIHCSDCSVYQNRPIYTAPSMIHVYIQSEQTWSTVLSEQAYIYTVRPIRYMYTNSVYSIIRIG